MRFRPAIRIPAAIYAACFCSLLVGGPAQAADDTLPANVADADFWRLVTSFSERAGSFPSDNLLSNETSLQHVIPDLQRTVKPGGVYLGVGPEQNFTYMVALRPKMAFIFDIRRGNLALHLIYKALFELSADRAEFVSRLFARPRPAGLSPDSTVAEILEAVAGVESTESLYIENVRAVIKHLTKTHGFVLDAGDLLRLQHDYRAFHVHGPRIQYSSSRNTGRRKSEPTYIDLMLATDRTGQLRGYLSSHEAFTFMKRLETDNLVVPLVGNFGGSKAIRAVGKFLKDKSATVSAFYVSNVEEYLQQDGLMPAFCGNVTALPIDEVSTFIRTVRGTTETGQFTLHSQLASMAEMVKGCQ